MGGAPDDIAIFLEAGQRRVFVSALDWPGWARGGRTEELAVGALASYLPRYAPIARAAGLRPPPGELVVAERRLYPWPGPGWPPRCAARRIGWHVLDHLWEIDRHSGLALWPLCLACQDGRVHRDRVAALCAATRSRSPDRSPAPAPSTLCPTRRQAADNLHGMQRAIVTTTPEYVPAR
jgi:hypothetical protein